MRLGVAGLLFLFPVLAIACSGEGRRGDGAPTATRTPIPNPTNDVCGREAGPDYRGARLTGKTFEDDDLGCARFSEAKLQRINFSGTRLSLADFSGSELTEVTFTMTSLAGANFEGARLGQVEFDDANLRASNFLHARLVSVTFSNTTCPDGANSDDVGGSCAGHGLLPG